MIRISERNLENGTLSLVGPLLLSLARLDSNTNALDEDVLQILLGQRAALDVADSSILASDLLDLLWCDWALSHIAEALKSSWIGAQIALGSNQQEGRVGAVVLDLRQPFLDYVAERDWVDNREHDQEEIGLWVAQRAKAIVVVLASRIPETQVIWLSVN